MHYFKKYLSVFLTLILILSVFSACGKNTTPIATESVPAETQAEVSAETEAPAEQEVSAGFYQIGDKMDDFTITTYDGKEVSLYKILEEKDMVLLNLWATWCGPCGMEFPAMQEAYEKYQDKVEIIAISIESTDTDEVLANYVQEKGMTFYVARDNGIGTRIDSMYIPTSVVVDRFGTICLMESSAMPDPSIFENLFDIYTAEDYTKSVFVPSMLSEKPNAEPSDPEKLGDALNAEGSNLVFANSDNEYDWPMTVAQKDGRSVVSASNVGSNFSVSSLETQVDAKAGDVLVVEYKLQSQSNKNAMRVEVDGKSIKKTAISRDWCTFAYRFEEDGSHAVAVSFHIENADPRANGLWIDSIRVFSGDEATKALAANPQYPVAEVTKIKLLNEDAKAARVYEETSPDLFDPIVICSDKKLQMLVTLDGSVDPETVYLQDLVGNVESVISHMTEEGYVMEIPNAADGSIGYTTLNADTTTIAEIMYFNSPESVTAYLDLFNETYGSQMKWEYTESAPAGNVTYIVTYVDQNGDPVPGVMCQVCDESTCQVFTSNEKGVCKFTLPAKAYEIHTLKVPEGYEGDTTTITNAPVQGGALTFALTKK